MSKAESIEIETRATISLRKRVLAVLAEHPEKKFFLDDLCKKLRHRGSRDALSAALTGLWQSGQIETDRDCNRRRFFALQHPAFPVWGTGAPKVTSKPRAVTFDDDWAPQKNDPIRGGYAPYQRSSMDAL